MKLLLILLAIGTSDIVFAQNAGIGTTTPFEKLEIIGNIKADTAKLQMLKIAGNAANKLIISDYGTEDWAVALSQNFSSGAPLSSTAITQTFSPDIPGAVHHVRFDMIAPAGSSISIELRDEHGTLLSSHSTTFASAVNGLAIFPMTGYVNYQKIYTLSVTGSTSIQLKYQAAGNQYPDGSSSLGADADLAFEVDAWLEEVLISSKNNKVGIGEENPTEKLHVSGKVKAQGLVAQESFRLITGGGVGKVLTSDANGIGTWSATSDQPGTIKSTGNIAGVIGGTLPALINTYEFVGPTATVTVNGSQRIVLNLVAGLGRSTTGSAAFRIDGGYQLQPAGSIINASGTNQVIYQPLFPSSTDRRPWPVSVSFKPAAGTYKIGFVLYCPVAAYLNNNDYLNGYYMIVNE